MDQNQQHGLDIALDEATLLGLEVDPTRRIAAATFSVLTLPQYGPPADSCVQFMFTAIGLVAASYCLGHWDDGGAEVVPFPITDLRRIVQSFGGSPIYGGEFFDADPAVTPLLKVSRNTSA